MGRVKSAAGCAGFVCVAYVHSGSESEGDDDANKPKLKVVGVDW